MKKYLCCMFCMMLLLSGCTRMGSHLFINQRELTSETSWEMKYSKFEGFSQRKIKISDVPTILKCEIHDERGLLNIIVKRNGTTVFATNKTNTFTLEQKGTYTLRVEGDAHKGNFTIHW